jgi:creatinine amidohydrolase
MRGIVSFSAIALSIVLARHTTQYAPPVQGKGVRLAEITWQQAADVLRPETVVVIPLGAGSKEHGPHLKLGNDAALAEYLTNRVLQAADVVVAPPLPYHYYPAFTEYPGSTSLTLETARALTTEAALGLSRFGPRRFYVVNTGVSSARALEPAARALASEGVLLGYTDLASRLDRASTAIRQQEGGTHADEIETSMMLYIDAASVDMRRAVREYTPTTGSLHLTRRRGASGTFSESGVWGDPTLATREKGRVIVESLVSGILEDIDSLRRATAPVPTVPTRAMPPAPTEMSAGRPVGNPRGLCTPGDERTLRSIGDALTLHWRNADAAQLAALWAADGDIVHPDGLTERGRETIRAHHAALFLRREYRGSAHPVTLGAIRCPSPGIAVADGRWEMRGVTDASGAVLPTFEGLVTLVLSRGSEGWSIEAYRYTQKPAAAPLPTWLKRPGYPGGAS